MNDRQREAEPEAAAGVVKSAGRAFEVLELFRVELRQLTAAEIGQALGYPKSSTNALLKSLVSLGYLVLHPRTLRYFPSLSVTRLGDWIPSAVLEAVSHVQANQDRGGLDYLFAERGTGGWYFQFENELYPDVDDSAVVIMALSKLKIPGRRTS